MTTRRLEREFTTLSDDLGSLFKCELQDDDLFTWKATMTGPQKTKLAGLKFELDILISPTYPFHPPKVVFRHTRNINTICTDLLTDAWSPALTIEKLILSVFSLLMERSRSEANLLAINPDCV
jgi:ubiquitin-protein ligase